MFVVQIYFWRGNDESICLEKMSSDQVGKDTIWNWTPTGENAEKIFASGANTSSQTSTYAAEKDSRSDSDRPNEGMFVA